MTRFDVVVVGAGILGLSTAYHLKRQHPEKRVLLIDKEPAAGQGNTAKSAQCFRNLYTSYANFLLSDSSTNFYFHVQNELGYDLGMRKVGYLFLMSEQQYRDVSKIVRKAAPLGVETKTYEREDLEKSMGMNTDLSSDEEAEMMGLLNVDKGVLCVKAGYLSSDALVRFFEQEFKRLKGEVLYNTRAESLILDYDVKIGISQEPLIWQDKRVTGVSTSRGDFYAEETVIAMGTWCNTILDPVGIDSHMKPKKRQIFVVKAESEELKRLLNTRGFNEENCLPIIILPSPSLFIKPMVEENSFWMVYPNHLGIEFRLEDDPQPHENYFTYGIRPVLTKYFPQFTGAKPSNMWAGQRECSTIDRLPYVFKRAGVVIVTGAHGRGVKQADSIGRIAAGLCVDQEYVELYGGRRFKVADLGVKERNVEREEFPI
ncbi:MAG: NAD(P)/FAD-dependent oxidoreductase [Candidatus Geothermarchaeales archaeon]